MRFIKSTVSAQLLLASVFLAACSGLPSSSTSSGTGTGTGPFTIGGTVTGLTGTGLVLQDNGADNLAVKASGSVTFATQPTNQAQSCAVTGGSGKATANVTTIAIACTTAATNATIGVTVSGL